MRPSASATLMPGPRSGTPWPPSLVAPPSPDARMYNSMVVLLRYSNQVDVVFEMLDKMVPNAVFPDGYTYNVMLQFMVKGRKLRDTAVVFKEMRSNEFVPTIENWKVAFKVFMDRRDRVMMVNKVSGATEVGVGEKIRVTDALNVTKVPLMLPSLHEQYLQMVVSPLQLGCMP